MIKVQKLSKLVNELNYHLLAVLKRPKTMEIRYYESQATITKYCSNLL